MAKKKGPVINYSDMRAALLDKPPMKKTKYHVGFEFDAIPAPKGSGMRPLRSEARFTVEATSLLKAATEADKCIRKMGLTNATLKKVEAFMDFGFTQSDGLKEFELKV